MVRSAEIPENRLRAPLWAHTKRFERDLNVMFIINTAKKEERFAHRNDPKRVSFNSLSNEMLAPLM